jgi:asparagine synthase (glutamine-hydrolysing)
MSDRNIGCLLSGGLDSSIVCALIIKYMKEHNQNTKNLHTFCIGLENATDLKYAKIVSEYLGTTHHEIIVSENDLLSEINNTIYQIESYDITTVRASIPMFLLSKYIKSLKTLDIAVLFSGEGSDEISGSYLYFHNAPDDKSFFNESKRLLLSLYKYDILRADKCVSGGSLELRVPFLDKIFVKKYMSVHPKYKLYNGIEKYILRRSFEDLLPKEIIWRTKEAFSDGISKLDNSWYQILNKFLLKKNTNEQDYYKYIYDSFFPNHLYLIPYYWMPKWNNNVSCPSARELDIYKEKINFE